MSNLMCFKIALVILLGTVVAVYVHKRRHRRYLEKCLRSSHADSSREDNH